jgi:predicted esterase
MEPLPGKTGDEAALIFFIGDACDQAKYLDHLKEVQEKVPFPLWIGIPHIIFDMPIPVGIWRYVDNMKSELRDKGVKSEKFFYGGHSLGGSSISGWVHKNPEEVEGAFAWGAYISREVEDPAKNYGVPFLTVGA